jgi:hypothetical protein
MIGLPATEKCVAFGPLIHRSRDAAAPTLGSHCVNPEITMADAHTPSLLARWTRSKRSAPRSPEPADMGTAFGMECSLDQSPVPSDASAAASPAEPGWLERWRAGRTST